VFSLRVASMPRGDGGGDEGFLRLVITS
jgi:hypothetical protein